MVTVLLFATLFSAHASEGDGATDTSETPGATTPVSQTHAEYVRLSQEMEKLATRNAWPGVEKMYLDLVATGETPSFADYLIGAHAARALGDVKAARERLLGANTVQNGDQEVIDWLWDIDSNYGPVFLAGDLGKASLDCANMPFDPNQAQAIAFAKTQIDATGVFDGYLPQGDYVFAKHDVQVKPRVDSPHIDLRTGDVAPTHKTKKKKKGD